MGLRDKNVRRDPRLSTQTKKNEEIGQATGLGEEKCLQRPEAQYLGQRKMRK